MDPIVIVGSSGHAKVIVDIVEREGRYKIAGLIDRFRKQGEQTLGYDILGKEEDVPTLVKEYSLKGCLLAIGDNYIRSQVATRMAALCPNLPFVSAIHPGAVIGRDVVLGEGTVVMAGAVVNPSSSLGRFCILNTNASLDHDSRMEDFSSLGPRAVTGGNCHIAAFAVVSIGATLIHGISIGEHSVVGAGSTVLSHIEAFRVAYGIPAKIIRSRKAGDKYL